MSNAIGDVANRSSTGRIRPLLTRQSALVTTPWQPAIDEERRPLVPAPCPTRQLPALHRLTPPRCLPRERAATGAPNATAQLPLRHLTKRATAPSIAPRGRAGQVVPRPDRQIQRPRHAERNRSGCQPWPDKSGGRCRFRVLRRGLRKAAQELQHQQRRAHGGRGCNFACETISQRSINHDLRQCAAGKWKPAEAHRNDRRAEASAIDVGCRWRQ